MSLIDIKEYRGSEIGIAVMEALEMIGIVHKLNINGYHLSIDGVHGITPKGMIEDTPDNHKITIERHKFIGNKNKNNMKHILRDNDKIDEILSQQEQFNIDFDERANYEITHQVKEDSNGDIWYNHRVEFEIGKTVLQTTESYVKGLFETVTDYVVNSFESMYEEM